MPLACRHLTVEYTDGRGPALRVLNDLDVSFPSGGISLITGPAGCGKSTLLHVLGGLLSPTAGEVLAEGRPVSRWQPEHRDRWRAQVGILFQHLHLLPDLPVRDNILLPLIPRRKVWPQMEEMLQTWLAVLALTDLQDVPVKRLSGGQRQRTALARAMIGVPRYLLLDEPTTFQDDAGVQALYGLWRQAARKGACIVVCSHDTRLRGSQQVDQRYQLNHGKLECLA